MYVAMNRFKIIKGEEQAFEKRWNGRDADIVGCPGFVEFHLLRGPEFDDHTLYVSHTIWASEKDMDDWANSEIYRKAHDAAEAKRGEKENVYLLASFEGFNPVRTVKARE